MPYVGYVAADVCRVRRYRPLAIVCMDSTCATGTPTLYHGDHKVGEGAITTQLGAFAIAGAPLLVGRHGGEPVTDDYPGERPWAFAGGTIKQVIVDVSGEHYIDLEKEAVAMMSRE